MSAFDNYSHPDSRIMYIRECVRGPGIDQDEMNDYYAIRCACAHINEGTCNNDISCKCSTTFRANYKNGLLRDEKLDGHFFVYECGLDTCECAPDCQNVVVQRGTCPNLEIKNSGEKGFGVFTQKALPKGSFIAEYTGELIGFQEADNRYNLQSGSQFIVALREQCTDDTIETYVDATHCGNIARYINHSCDPNCLLVPVRTGKVIPRICIFAAKDIEAGEEVAYNYDACAESLSTVTCLCGAKSCKGFLPKCQLSFSERRSSEEV